MAHGTNIHLLTNPFGTIVSDAFLLKTVGELKTVGIENERLLFGLLRIERGNETWLPK